MFGLKKIITGKNKRIAKKAVKEYVFELVQDMFDGKRLILSYPDPQMNIRQLKITKKQIYEFIYKKLVSQI